MTDEQEQSVGSVCRGWWHRWVGADDGAARAARAQLRRVTAPLEAALIPAVHDLNAALAGIGHDLRSDPARLALIATALAACPHPTGRRAARAFGLPKEQPALSALRFNRLVRETDPMRLRQPLIRALAQVGGQVDVKTLADDLFWWTEKTRTRWTFEYFGASDAVPEPEEETTI